MGRFQLVRPTTVAEGVAELDRLGDQARIYAGGAELLLLMRNNVVQPDHLIDIKRIAGLDELAWDGNVLRIGATVTHRRLERDEHVRRGFPAFADAESRIGNIRVRTQGTLGGNLCFADPHADPATPLLVHDTVTTVAGPMGTREIPLADLITGTYETALEPNEILTRVDVPPLPEAWRESFHRIERYYRPTANVAVAARISGGTIADLRMAVGCIGPITAATARDLGLRVDIEPPEYTIAAFAGAIVRYFEGLSTSVA